jgi:murein DD-endopeptidase MepM/ murein hydrolase activator NlpD
MSNLKFVFLQNLKKLTSIALFRSPALLLPATAGFLVILLSTVSFFIPNTGSNPEASPKHQLISSVQTVYKSLGIPYDDEFGFTREPDFVKIEQGETDDKQNVRQKSIRQGESLYSILVSAGLTPTEVHTVTSQLKGKFVIKDFKPGQPYEIETNANGTFNSFSYHLNTANILHLEKDEHTGELNVWRETLDYDTRLATLEGNVSGSFSRELQQHGRSGLISQLKELFSSKLNFQRDIQPGTNYRVLFEEQWIEDEFVSTGKILAVEIMTKNNHYSAYRFTDSKGITAYYDDKGRTLQNRFFFGQPCSYRRITSGFGYRVHPIRRTVHFHGGVDMAAAVGTPVRAVADGKIMFRGRQGGAGNMITIAHADKYHTQYLHLSRFSPKSSYGGRVQQGDIIGYVGSTGSSTGPHLDFRVIKNGKLQNPLVALSTAAPSNALSRAEMGNFLARLDLYHAQLDNKQIILASVTKKRGAVL